MFNFKKGRYDSFVIFFLILYTLNFFLILMLYKIFHMCSLALFLKNYYSINYIYVSVSIIILMCFLLQIYFDIGIH